MAKLTDEIEDMRAAVSELRHDYARRAELGDDHAAFHLAVADWIDSHCGDLANSGGNLGSCDSPGDVEQAIAVARAWRGVPALEH